MANDNQLNALERLTKLRDSSAITEAEFIAQKAKILGGGASHVPFYRRLWIVVLLTCLILTFWLALLILATGDVYKRKDGSLVPITKTTRYVYASFLGLWLAAVAIRTIADPNSLKREWAENQVNEKQAGEQSASNTPAGSTAAAASDEPVACDSSDAAEMVKAALEGSSSALETVKVLDFGHAEETIYDKDKKVRGCKADAELSTGGGLIAYQLYFGPSGKQLVQVEQGTQAEMRIEVDAALKHDMAAKEAAPAQAQAPEQTPGAAPAQDQPTPQPDNNSNPTSQDNSPADQPNQNAQPQPNNQ